METRSTQRSGSGSASASATRKAISASSPRAIARSRPTPSMAALMSDRIAGPPPRFSQPKVISPVPPARSSSVRLRPRVQGGDEIALPDPVHAERHQVVHQVVARRHAVEHRAHQSASSAARHGAEAEIDGLSAGVVAFMDRMYSLDFAHAGTPRSRDCDARPGRRGWTAA